MAKKAREMSAMEVRLLTVPGLHAVGGVPGLYLQVPKSTPDKAGTVRTACVWILRITVGNARRSMGLGGFPAVPLAQARDLARSRRAEVDGGIDPIEARRAAQSLLRASQASALTFEQCAALYIAANRAGWRSTKHAQQWGNSLRQHAFPVLGALLVRDVALPHVLKVLEPIWLTTTETASRLRSRIELVLDWATARGYREGANPARWRGHLDKLLPKPGKVAVIVHHRALPIGDVGAAVLAVRSVGTTAALALEFAILTAARSGEVRGATWDEIDLDAALWIVPAGRMKAGIAHRVALSPAALSVLAEAAARPRVDGSEIVFAAPRGGALSNLAMTLILRRLGIPAVPHGFRSTFRDWAAERTSYAAEVAEMALAHAVGSKVKAAYRRGDLLDKRRSLMVDWAGFLAQPENKANIHEH